MPQTFLRFYLSLSAILICSGSMADPGLDKIKNAEKTEEVVAILKNCPSWCDFSGSSLEKRQKVPVSPANMHILDAMHLIAKYNTNTIGAAVRQYLSALSGKNPDSATVDLETIHRSSKVYLLTRYIFNVPQRIPMKLSRKALPADPGAYEFHAWRNRFRVAGMWPLSFDRQEHLVLTGRLNYIAGPGPDTRSTLIDFAYCKQHFGRRTQY